MSAAAEEGHLADEDACTSHTKKKRKTSEKRKKAQEPSTISTAVVDPPADPHSTAALGVKKVPDRRLPKTAHIKQLQQAKGGDYMCIGQMKDAVRHGDGEMTYENNDTHVGGFQNDKHHGFGTLT